MNIARPLRMIATVAALVAVALGMGTYTHANFRDIHMLFGLIVALALLVLAVMATFTAEARRLGAIGIAYAFLLPIFGVTQQMILVGEWHWLVETTHLAVGFGAVALIGVISGRLARRSASNVLHAPVTAEAARPAQPIG